jgi:long-chain acyl-CoA synthetase
MADRIWLKNYPAGIPADIDPDRFKSLADLFDHIVDKFADKPALQNLGCTMS